MKILVLQHVGKTLEKSAETRRLVQAHNALLLEVFPRHSHHTVLGQHVRGVADQDHILSTITTTKWLQFPGNPQRHNKVVDLG